MKNKISIIETNMGEPRVVFKLESEDDVSWVESMVSQLNTMNFGLTFNADDAHVLPSYYCVLETGHADMKVNEFIYTDESLSLRFAIDTEIDIMTELESDECIDTDLLQFVKALRAYIIKTNNGGLVNNEK